MGNLLGCIDEMQEIQRMKYDMSPLKLKKVPIVWLVGPPGSGRRTQGDNMSKQLRYEQLRIAEMFRNEAKKETERGKLIKSYLESTKRIPDPLVIDLIKEEMLSKASEANGYILNGFPRTSKQALLFVKEISNVDVIIYLYSHTNDMIARVQQKLGASASPDSIRRDIIAYMRETKEGTAKFSSKLERIYTDSAVNDVYRKIEAALNLRLQLPKTTLEATSKVTVKSEI